VHSLFVGSDLFTCKRQDYIFYHYEAFDQFLFDAFSDIINDSYGRL